MRKKYIFGKKLYISVLTSILVLLTTVATTFAWVGVFANSTFEQFEFSIKPSKYDANKEYNIEISLNGIDFFSEISFDSIKPIILKNWGYENVDSMSKDTVNLLFQNLNQDQCTTIPVMEGNKIKKLGNFIDIEGNSTSKMFKFDIYLSAYKIYDQGSSSNFSMDVFLHSGLLTGQKKSYVLKNPFTYQNTFVNPYDTLGLSFPNYRTIQANEKIFSAKVDSASAARVAFEKYPVVSKGHPELYTSSVEPVSSLIFQDSYEYPVQNLEDNSYSFGAIVPDDYNLAVGYYNSTEYAYYKYKIKSVSLPDEILTTRSVLGTAPDIRLTKETNQLIDATNPDEQIGIDTMMKMTVYFWFEGWDADCFPVINYSPVSINIGLMMTNDENE